MKPIFLKIADGIMDSILEGALSPGGRVPSVRETAANSQVNVNTVVRSYETLERDGIIFQKRGLGYFVADDAEQRIRRQRSEEFYATEMDYFFARLSQIGMTPVELLQRYETYLKLK